MTENNISSASDTITMYCTQPDLVWDIVDKDGVNYVKQAYITKKYQDTAWIFDTAYKFFRQEALKFIPAQRWRFLHQFQHIPCSEFYSMFSGQKESTRLWEFPGAYAGSQHSEPAGS